MAPTDDGSRVDLFLLRCCPGTRRSLIREAIAQGWIQVNGRRCVKGQLLHTGDQVEVHRLAEGHDSKVIPQPELPLDILVLAEEWLAVNKPAGWATQPLRTGETGTLANALAARHPECFQIGELQSGMGGLLHRLDRGTSGVVLAARTQRTWERLRWLFTTRQVLKGYLAVVRGRVDAPTTVCLPLEHDPRRPGRMRPNERSPWLAETHIEPMVAGIDRTLIRATMRTGVTHQVRCHLAAVGHPIIGDRLYGGPPWGDGSRFLLHAEFVEFADPKDNHPVRVAAPLPAEFARALERSEAGRSQSD